MATPQSCDGLLTDLSRNGDRPAVFALRKRDSETWSYADLAGCVDRLAHGLRHAGLARGARAAIMADNGPGWIAAALAIIRAGGVVVPLDVQLGEKALRHVFGDSTPRFVFTTKNRAERIAACAEHARLVLLEADQDERSWRQLLLENAGALPELRPEDHATLFYTSGTTGPPKGVPLTHSNLSVQIDAALATCLTSENDHLLLPLPLHHVYPFVIGMLAPLTRGLTVVIPQSLTGPQIIRALQEGEINVVIGVPRLYRALYSGIQARLQSTGPVRGGIARKLLVLSIAIRRRFGVRAGKILLRPLHRQLGSQLRLLASGGAALDPELAMKLEGLGWQVAIGYGLTETSPLLTFNLPGQASLDSVGKPIQGVELRINPKTFEKEERVGGPEGQGEVLARGPSVFTGYRNLEEKTREAFTEDGWFRTGDLGFMDDEGNLHLLGRVSTLIVTEGGKKVQPDDVEEAYAEEKAIREIGVLQKDGKLVALIVPGKHGEQNVEHAIREAIERVSRRLPPYQRVSDYSLTREAIRRTRLGKIRRHLLSERYEKAKEGEEVSQERLAGPMPIEEMSGEDRALLDDHAAQATWELLARRYKDKRLTPDSNPGLDLGIDSLEWLNLTFEIRENAGVELTEAAIARIEAIRDLLREVSEASEAESESQPLDRPEEILTDKQKRWLEPPGLVVRLVARILFFANRTIMRTLFRVEAKGLDRLPENAQFVFAPNHTSYLDPPALGAVLSNARLARTYWGGWSVIVTRNVFTRFIGRLANAVPIDPERGAISSLAFGAVLLKYKLSIVWFSEGGLSRTGELQPFKPGIGIVLARFPVPVVPVFIAGTHEV